MRLFDSQELPGHYVSASHQKPASMAIIKRKNGINFFSFIAVLWILIRMGVGSDPHYFAGSGSVSGSRSRAWRFGSQQMKKLITLTFFQKISLFCQKYWTFWHWGERRCALNCEYLREFSKKLKTALMGWSGAWGKLIYEKTGSWKIKISWHCPFKSDCTIPASSRLWLKTYAVSKLM